MKNKFLMLTFSIVIIQANAQLTVQSGASITSTGSAVISLNNMDLQNNGTINQATGTGKFVFTGATNNNISGTNTPVIDKLEIAKTGNAQLSLQQSINIGSSIQFTSGLIDLNNHNILLQPTALLVGENEASHITGATGGYTEITVPLNAPSAVNPGNLGAIISSTQNLGNTLIRCGHTSQMNSPSSSNSIYRYYDITPANNTALNATLRLFYFDTELNGLAENTLELWKNTNSSTWANTGYTSRDAAANYVEKTGINDFSRWTLFSSNNPLPLVLTTFKASCNNGNAVLAWKTVQEQNTHHFTAQKSKDGMNWQSFATVAAAGNSSTERSYTITDFTPFVDGTFYRIAAYDIDGSSHYTGIEKSQCYGNSETVSIYPNPIQDQFTINLLAATPSSLLIKITDVKGALVYQQTNALQTGSNQIKVNAKSLPATSYYLSLEWNNGQGKSTTKIIKQ